ncbi:uncharacterized protein LOC120532257 isoform X3 [Polypterus senegalus]|uniref:uncharacterized protein LOC120532257 isoform X3 n=1 Tax=Polypterus senegalus TaxID=55291 RepID=UPI00196323C9|nr:uncharacterized protein LOC120532257 isoform X3 [Polypterus senegalus]
MRRVQHLGGHAACGPSPQSPGPALLLPPPFVWTSGDAHLCRITVFAGGRWCSQQEALSMPVAAALHLAQEPRAHRPPQEEGRPAGQQPDSGGPVQRAVVPAMGGLSG